MTPFLVAPTGLAISLPPALTQFAIVRLQCHASNSQVTATDSVTVQNCTGTEGGVSQDWSVKSQLSLHDHMSPDCSLDIQCAQLMVAASQQATATRSPFGPSLPSSNMQSQWGSWQRRSQVASDASSSDYATLHFTVEDQRSHILPCPPVLHSTCLPFLPKGICEEGDNLPQNLCRSAGEAAGELGKSDTMGNIQDLLRRRSKDIRTRGNRSCS